MLTGRPPFRGTTALETLAQVMPGPPDPALAVRPGLPRDLETICLKCLDRGAGTPVPLGRGSWPRTCAATSRASRSAPVRSPPEDGCSSGRGDARGGGAGGLDRAGPGRHPGRRFLVELLADPPRRDARGGARTRAAEQATAAHIERARAEQQERIARRHWHGSQVKLAQQAWEAGHVELAQELLANERLEAGGGGLQGFEWSYLHRLCHRDFSLLWGHTAALYSLAVSADGRTLASCDLYGKILLHDLATGRARTASGSPVLSLSRAALRPGDTTRPPGQSEFSNVKIRDLLIGSEWTAPRSINGLVYLVGFAARRIVAKHLGPEPGRGTRTPVIAWSLAGLGSDRPGRLASGGRLPGVRVIGPVAGDGRSRRPLDPPQRRTGAPDHAGGNGEARYITWPSPAPAIAWLRLSAIAGAAIWETGSGRSGKSLGS